MHSLSRKLSTKKLKNCLFHTTRRSFTLTSPGVSFGKKKKLNQQISDPIIYPKFILTIWSIFVINEKFRNSKIVKVSVRESKTKNNMSASIAIIQNTSYPPNPIHLHLPRQH